MYSCLLASFVVETMAASKASSRFLNPPMSFAALQILLETLELFFKEGYTYP